MLKQPQSSLLAVFRRLQRLLPSSQVHPRAQELPNPCPRHSSTQNYTETGIIQTLPPDTWGFLPGQRHSGAVKWGYMLKTGYSTIQYVGSDPVQGQDFISKLSFIPYWSCCICQWTADVSAGTLPTILLSPMTAFHSINFYNRHVYQPQRQIYRWWQESFKIGVWAFKSWHKHFHKIVLKMFFKKIYKGKSKNQICETSPQGCVTSALYVAF